MKPRVTIFVLMVVVAVVATSLVALRSTLEIWASAYFSLTVVLLCTAIPGMAFRRGISRAFWAGFASFGWTYLVLCFGPVPSTSFKPPPLLTTKLLEVVYPYLSTVPPKEVTVFGQGVWDDSRNIKVTTVATTGGITFFRNDTEDFQRSGHAIANLIFACAGGLVAHRFASSLGDVERT
jgi:hypothetical protein